MYPISRIINQRCNLDLKYSVCPVWNSLCHVEVIISWYKDAAAIETETYTQKRLGGLVWTIYTGIHSILMKFRRSEWISGCSKESIARSDWRGIFFEVQQLKKVDLWEEVRAHSQIKWCKVCNPSPLSQVYLTWKHLDARWDLVLLWPLRRRFKVHICILLNLSMFVNQGESENSWANDKYNLPLKPDPYWCMYVCISLME